MKKRSSLHIGNTGALLFAGVILFFVFQTGAPVLASSGPLAERAGFFFDTVISIALYDTDDESVLDACFEQMSYFEDRFSRTKEGSDIWNINHAGGEAVEVCDDTLRILQSALHYCELSDGVFDITIAPVVSLWDFSEGAEPKLPSEKELEEAVSHVDYHCVEIDGNKVSLADPEAGIDLGAIAKGYISDRLRDIILENGCRRALINLGGNVLAVGSKSEDKDFKIGIRRPFGTDAYDLIRILDIHDCSVITSGTYERFFELDGVIYHHILDPESGYPVENGLSSVSILSADGTDGDALSTTCFALGPEKGMELVEQLDGIEAMFIDGEENVTVSSGWPAE